MNTKMVKLSEIKEQFNPRSDFSGVDELAKSIESVGLLQPLVVRIGRIDGSDDLHPILVDGAQRLRALKKLGQKETQVIVIDAKSAEEAQMAANLMRSDLNILERARGYERMVRLFPTKYNAVGIAKMFGDKKAHVEQLISVAKRIPANFDGKLGPMIGRMDFDDLEMLAEVPNDGKMDKVIEAIRPADNNPVNQAIHRVFKQFHSWSTCPLTVSKLEAAGRAFKIDGEYYTQDPAAIKEAEKAHQAKQRETSSDGSGKKMSEKEKTERRNKIAKDRKDNAEAKKVLPALIKKVLAGKPTQKELDDLGQNICGRSLNHDSAGRLAAMFGVKLNSAGSVREACYRQVFKPMCTTPESIVKLFILTEHFGYASEREWLKALKR